MWDRLRDILSFGRANVGLGAAVGIAFFLRQLLAQDEDLYTAFLKGLGAMFVVMVVLGVSREFWRGKRVREAQGPGGTGGVGFADESKATQEAVDELNTRVTKQMDHVNKRLYDLESAVFKGGESGDETGE